MFQALFQKEEPLSEAGGNDLVVKYVLCKRGELNLSSQHPREKPDTAGTCNPVAGKVDRWTPGAQLTDTQYFQFVSWIQVQ